MHMTHKLILLGILCCSLTGCTLDRTWFQMSSNSPMPFLGLDFRLPRKTTSLEPVNHEEKLARHWNSEDHIQTVSLKEDSESIKEENLFSKLPKIPNFVHKDQTETLSFTGPKARFSR